MSSLNSVQQCPFVDRRRELEALERAYAGRPALAVVYGRRRIGKTRLIREWLERRHPEAPTVFYTARLASHEFNLRAMAWTASHQLGAPMLERVHPRDLPVLLELLAGMGAEVVVIDEITYWVRSWPGVASELQYFVDHVLPRTGMLLVLTGSILGVMETALLGGSAPLYARATVRLRLRPLRVWHLRELLERLAPADLVRAYSVIGGVPFYACIIRGLASIEDIVERLVLLPESPLRSEKDLLLREEFRDPHAYSAILSAIARGYRTPSTISQVTGLDRGHVSRYLHRLETLGLVRRETPLFKRKGYYTISDPPLRAWYHLVEPIQELLELERLEEASREVLERLERLTASVWEELAREHLLAKYAREGYTLSGRLAHKGEELDIAIIDPRRKRAVVAEAKWADLTPREAITLRQRAIGKAHQLLPQDYTLEDALVAARSITGRKPEWTITPEDITAPPRESAN